ncbi:hypothetical protein HGO38_01540 [Rhizobium sp. CG5]|uniref:hypothetical protein n=1 Tax=Rhizobium sp. CG5 TaxID=2726076 RepID=UPI00203339FF|nr:hypothetical protein [Rhizobium sp. CG5]MCM2472159.1 hypothetical protein [Rhizobium sp. CG5]
MKNISTGFLAALVAAREDGIVPRRLVYITAKDRETGDPVEVGIWTGDDDVNIPVLSGLTGTEETRTYYGGLNLSVGEIPRVSDLTTQTVTIEMSQIAEITQLLVRGYDVRLAKVEIHDLLLDPRSRMPVAPAEIAFLGEVDGAPIDTPAAGSDGKITLNVVSDAISMLSRTNPAKSSYQGQKRRSDDRWGRYKGTVGNWELPWGQKAT